MEIISVTECYDHQFLLLTQDCLLAQHVLEATRAEFGMC